MNSQIINGRRLYRVCGRSVIHSDIMDCLYHNDALTQAIPLFEQALKGGRFSCELVGYLSFPVAAVVQVMEIGSFKHAFCDSLFSDSFVNKATQMQAWNNNHSIQLASAPSSSQNIITGSQAGYQSYPYYEYRGTMADGTARIFIPTLTYIFQGSPEIQFSAANMKLWFDSHYIPSVPKTVPAVGMSYEQIIALGWKEKLFTFTRWINPTL